jgi:hydrogenase nickel incorporation protein HypA/HybF
MHELSITRSVIAIVREHAAGRRVTRVRLEIGCLAAVMPDAIRFCFDVCAADTSVAGALLEIDEIPGLGRCTECRAEVRMTTLSARCPCCGSMGLHLIAGQELNIKEMETEPCA